MYKYILRKHASVNIKYIALAEKEQEVHFISSHVGILHKEQLTLQQTNYFLQNLTSLMTCARARVSALFRSSLTGRIRTRVRRVDLGGYLLLLLRQGQGHAYRHDKQLTGDLETYYAR